jgi:tetratricopeptide (TPR) repeat protein
LLAFVFLAGAARVWLYQAVEVPKAAGINLYNGLLELHVLVRYLGLLVYPASQSIVQPVYLITSVTDTRVLVAGGVLAALAALGMFTRHRLPAVTVGLIWFFALLLPSASLIVLASFGEAMSEHRAYLASAGFFVAITAPLARTAVLPGGRRFVALVGGIAAVLAVLAATAIARNRVWQTPLRLWEDAANKAPQAWMAVYALADAYRASGDHLRAVEGYRRAVGLSTGDPTAYVPLAESLLQLGRVEAAREALREAVTKNPTNVPILLARASLEESVARDHAVALQMCQRALALEPANQEALACVQRTPAR